MKKLFQSDVGDDNGEVHQERPTADGQHKEKEFLGAANSSVDKAFNS